VLETAPGVHLPESGAILLYLAEGTPLLPGDRDERAQVHRWMFFEQGSIYPQVGALRFRLLSGRLDPESDEARRGTAIAGALTAVVERHLTGREFVAADRYTVADIALYGYVHVAGDAGVDLARLPSVSAWLERVREQPGHVADLAPYAENARPGASRSIYDAFGL
jgi:glutathione S-transferase